MKNIKEVRFPNTVDGECQNIFRLKCDKAPNGVDKINIIQKNGEMASINWLEIVKDGKVIAEIKESVCDIYGEDILPDKTNLPF